MNVDASRLEDRLDPLEPPYKSRGEAKVGRLLDRYGIPFFYEQPIVVFDRGKHRIWRPDFTLPSCGGLIVEYAGMPDVLEYAAGICHKHEVYSRNRVRAAFVYPRDLQGPDWPQRVMERIDAAAHRIPPALHLNRYEELRRY